jgi:Domain of unknown function (DUF4136)
MNKLRILLIALLPFAAISAMSQDVRFNFDETADFGKFKTYKWVTIEGVVQAEGLTKEQIEAAFDTELAKKGFAKVDNDNADLFVAYQFGIHSEQKMSSFAADAEYSVGLPLGGSMLEEDSVINRGELALDMYATSKRIRVWRGVATKKVDLNAKPNARQKHLAKATKKLLEYYPPIATSRH